MVSPPYRSFLSAALSIIAAHLHMRKKKAKAITEKFLDQKWA
jgi:hypothetical protein